MNQLDIFGNIIRNNEFTKKTQSNRFSPRKMQGKFRARVGFDKRYRCKDCESFFELPTPSGRTYFKCFKLGDTNSSASDIRKSDYACSLFKQK